MTWVISIAIAVVILIVILLILSNDKFAYIFGVLFYLGIAISVLTFLVRYILFSWR